MKIKQLLILSIITGCVLSCSKKDPTPKSKEELLTNNSSKTWRKTGSAINGVPSSLLDCEKDNSTILSSDKSLQYKYGSNKCTSLETDFNSTWSFNTAQDSLTILIKISSGSFGYTLTSKKYKIVTLSESSLKLSESYSASGFSAEVIDTYEP